MGCVRKPLQRSILLFLSISLGLLLLVIATTFILNRANVIQVSREVRAGDLISATAFFATAAGLFLNWWQLSLGGIRKRAEFIVSIFNQFVTDSDSSQALYDIEYDRFQYSDSFHGSKEERRIDRLLYYFEKIAALYELGTISFDDLELVRYEFVRVYRNEEVQEYLTALQEVAEEVNVRGGSFERYRRVASTLSDSTV